MVDRRALAAALAVAGLIGGGWMIWAKLRATRTPEELFRRRCTQCHDLPNLSQFAKRDMEGIVRTMRERNGAAEVISQAEAAIIVRYLEETARW